MADTFRGGPVSSANVFISRHSQPARDLAGHRGASTGRRMWRIVASASLQEAFMGSPARKKYQISISLVLLHFICSPLECMWPLSQNSSPRPTSKKNKKKHLCRLIYKVLTPGPKKMSVVLAKCCLVYATANRCCRHAVEAGLFPPRRE